LNGSLSHITETSAECLKLGQVGGVEEFPKRVYETRRKEIPSTEVRGCYSVSHESSETIYGP